MEYYAGEDVPASSIYSADTDAERDGGEYPYTASGSRLQMDMYICVPYGNYELTVKTKSSNGGSSMKKIAWEVEYGPDEVGGGCRRACCVQESSNRPNVFLRGADGVSSWGR